jgi:hypothetical protein
MRLDFRVFRATAILISVISALPGLPWISGEFGFQLPILAILAIPIPHPVIFPIRVANKGTS